MNRILFTGIMPALPTPLNQKNEFQPEKMRELIEWELAAGVSGFYVGGATGEGVLLPAATRMEVIECAVEAVAHRAKVICHTGSIDCQEAFALTRHAEKAGADAVSSVPPDFYFGYSAREIVDYYRRLAGETNLPVIAYATQKTASLDMTGILRSLLAETANVIGAKDTRANYYKMWQLKQLDGGNINVINGPDESLLAGLSMGADGGIGATYNLMPEKFVALYRKFCAGDFAGALQEQTKINRIIEVLLNYCSGNVMRTLKLAMQWNGFDFGSAVYPASELEAKEAAAFRAALLEAGFVFRNA
ncbi:MAG: dihydrodipicolinate synthase family protein [Victivallaceae bacterium]|nr:dihydrodipicolinate synthase family protein [Victivallaceae bacterium]